MEEIFKMKKFINKTNKGYYNARIAEIKEKISDDNVDAMILLDTLADELTKDAQKATANVYYFLYSQIFTYDYQEIKGDSFDKYTPSEVTGSETISIVE
jgi:hypothetical protein